MSFQHINVPAKGAKITTNADFSLNVPDMPIIPFVEGDGIGADVTPVMQKVIDAAVQKHYMVVMFGYQMRRWRWLKTTLFLLKVR